MIYSLFSKIVTIIFPSKCIACGKTNTSLCSPCLQSCRKSIDTPALYSTSIYSFKDPIIKKLVHSIKYFHRRDLIKPIVTELANEIKKTTGYKLMATSWILVPIPMPRIRKYIRGYNQAELIAEELSKQCSLPLRKDILIRFSSPQQQVTTKTRSERLKNQLGTFAIKNNVSGMNIILVDDVTTTGATISSARDTLLQAGALEVRAVTIAH